jgi:thiol-disulfide isomerase/thioredoxin
MSARRILVGAIALGLAVAAVAAMVRYTKRVETELTKAPASAGSIKLLKERVEIAPFTASDLDGRPVSTAALRGKVVIVNFWATWCPPCREEIPDLVALQAKYKDSLQIIGVSQDSGSIDDVRRFTVEHRMNYPTVMTTAEIEKLFPGVYALPTSFILDREGKLAQKHVGLLNASLTELETRTLAGLEPDVEVIYAEDEDKKRLDNAAQANKIPGIDLAALSGEKKAEALKALNSEHCTCGCNLTLAQCRLDDPDCTVSLPLAQELVKKIAAGGDAR